jgi:hypothetical protein
MTAFSRAMSGPAKALALRGDPAVDRADHALGQALDLGLGHRQRTLGVGAGGTIPMRKRRSRRVAACGGASRNGFRVRPFRLHSARAGRDGERQAGRRRFQRACSGDDCLGCATAFPPGAHVDLDAPHALGDLQGNRWAPALGPIGHPGTPRHGQRMRGARRRGSAARKHRRKAWPPAQTSVGPRRCGLNGRATQQQICRQEPGAQERELDAAPARVHSQVSPDQALDERGRPRVRQPWRFHCTLHSAFILVLMPAISCTQRRRSACSSAMISDCGQWK